MKSSQPGDCQWCDADFSRLGRLLGSIAATLHAYRRHWKELELVSEGADPYAVESDEHEEWQCPECGEWNFIYHVTDDTAFCSVCSAGVSKGAEVPTRPREQRNELTD
jgi:phage FluMu protein Com